LDQLINRIEKQKRYTIGDLFLMLVGETAEYTDYILAYHKRTQTYNHLIQSNPKFSQFENCKNGGQYSTPSYLIMPLSRLQRYVLLLNCLQKYLVDEEEIKNVKLASIGLQERVGEINSKRGQESKNS